MFNSYEELMETVNKRQEGLLILEVDLNEEYSPEYEEAKKELVKAQAMKTLTGEQPFLNDNIPAIEARIEALRPEPKLVWIKYKRLDLMEWAVLVKQTNMTSLDQYEKVLNKTFIGVFNSPDAETPLSDDPRLLSSQSGIGILPGGQLHQVVQAFMSWQNSGGDVAIRPTKSGQD